MNFRFREVRKALRMTQTEAALPCGRDKRWLSDVELGKIKISFELAVQLARVYGTTPDTFLPQKKASSDCDKKI
ncbi:helix-turn-helix domain-containing protein [Lucifera butyrica]|uniref:helix-turn-helix domain-containing protein n=1 Tax=Lucifera butyrica TaxID=1351585 RepID=UPI000F02736D|nr:helix-turn-helix transcriptional regulator [Lucifera butyrica]